MKPLTSSEKKMYFGMLRASASRVLARLQLTSERVTKFGFCDEAELDAALEKLVSRFSAIGVNEDTAREIMGQNFFGGAECERHFGVKLGEIPAIPFTTDDFAATRETHVLVFVPPLSIEEIRAKHSQFFSAKNDVWYANEKFAANKPDAWSWHLVRKTLVSHSTSKSWSEQQALLGDRDIIPTGRVLVYTIIGHFLKTGERLFEKIYVRTSDLDSFGFRVRVGGFDSGGLYVSHDWDGYRYDGLGVASSRKFN